MSKNAFKEAKNIPGVMCTAAEPVDTPIIYMEEWMKEWMELNERDNKSSAHDLILGYPFWQGQSSR